MLTNEKKRFYYIWKLLTHKEIHLVFQVDNCCSIYSSDCRIKEVCPLNPFISKLNQ